jgi:hypothetical protein
MGNGDAYFIRIRQHTSAYVSIRKRHLRMSLTYLFVIIPCFLLLLRGLIRQHTSAYVSIRKRHLRMSLTHFFVIIPCFLLLLRLLFLAFRQYLYFCTSKAFTFVLVKQHTSSSSSPASSSFFLASSSFCVPPAASVFVLVKQVLLY